MAANYLVTLRRAGGASSSRPPARPPEALEPLMRRVIENDFELTGPIERGDWETVDRHRRGDPRSSDAASLRGARTTALVDAHRPPGGRLGRRDA